MTVWRWLSLVVGAAWTASIGLPVEELAYATGPQWERGYHVLAEGWLGPFNGQFGWYGNLAIFWALTFLFMRRRPKPLEAYPVAILLCLFVLNSAFWTGIQGDGPSVDIVAFGSGYYLWMSAMSAAGIALGVRAWLSRTDIE